MPAHRQTPAEYAREVFDTFTANGADYPSAMREARLALHDCRADDAELLAQTCPDTLPVDWSAC